MENAPFTYTALRCHAAARLLRLCALGSLLVLCTGCEQQHLYDLPASPELSTDEKLENLFQKVLHEIDNRRMGKVHKKEIEDLIENKFQVEIAEYERKKDDQKRSRSFFGRRWGHSGGSNSLHSPTTSEPRARSADPIRSGGKPRSGGGPTKFRLFGFGKKPTGTKEEG